MIFAQSALAAAPDMESTTAATQLWDDDYLVAPGFTNHLPLVITEFIDGGEATEASWWFTTMKLAVYDHGGENSLALSPTTQTTIHARILADDEDDDRPKHDYFVRLYGEDGQPSAQSLLGMQPASDYFLVGALHDRSLLRNYLGYTLASEVIENTPEVRFCEVLQPTRDGTMYQGVYLLVALRKPADTEWFRRDTDPDDYWLSSFAYDSGLDDGRWVYPFLESSPDEEALWSIAGGISTAEEVIYSDNLNTFSRYERYIDVASFSDFLIVNELMGNYVAMTNAYYTYNTRENKLAIGPVWNFERSLDNEIETPLEIWQISFSEAFFYERLLQSKNFIERLRARYMGLRIDTLNQAHYYELIEDAVAYLGPAANCDWHRWQGYFDENPQELPEPIEVFTYESGDEVTVPSFSRAPQTYDQEIVKLKYLLRDHDLFMAYQFGKLEEQSGYDLKGEESSYVRNAWYFVAFLAVLFLTVRIGRRYAKQV